MQNQPRLPQIYGDSFYRKTCQELSGYEFPGNKWKGATMLVKVEDGLFLIQRSASMPTHAGQIACVGGGRHGGEEDPVVTGKREFCEETGFGSDDLKVLGLLPPVFTASSSIIIPIVGEYSGTWNDFAHKVKPNEEWDLGFWVGFTEFEKEELWRYGKRVGRETTSFLLFFDLQNAEKKLCGTFKDGNKLPTLWGATARMVWNYLRLVYLDCDTNPGKIENRK
jgi:8-oxo-dGTP pyrophosphatase MutT (NUDIX family)